MKGSFTCVEDRPRSEITTLNQQLFLNGFSYTPVWPAELWGGITGYGTVQFSRFCGRWTQQLADNNNCIILS